MQRVTISLDETLGTEFDQLLRARGYQSRSEAVRDAVRDAIATWRDEQLQEELCVANLSYVYNRKIRLLAQRLSELQHDHHDLVVATTQVHLDHEHTLESAMLRGAPRQVRAFADSIQAERGVRFSKLNLIGVEANDEHDEHIAHHHNGHAHLSPRPG